MDRRPLGTTGHESSVLTFGAIALDPLDQSAADDLVDEVLDRGVNHVDVAPQYGTAEVKLGPRLQARRDEVFLGCKTLERSKEGAAATIATPRVPRPRQAASTSVRERVSER